MKQDTISKVQTILKEYEQGKGSYQELCKAHGISNPYFYMIRKQIVKTKKTKRKYTRAPKMLEIPIQGTSRDFVVICTADSLKRVMETLA